MTNPFGEYLADDIRATRPKLFADCVDPVTGDFLPDVYADAVDWDGDLKQLLEEETT